MFYALVGALAGALLGWYAYLMAGKPLTYEREYVLCMACAIAGAIVGSISGAAQAVVGAIRRLERHEKKATPPPEQDGGRG